MNIITREYYDPRAPRDFSPLKIGTFIVTRQPLHGTPHTRYSVTEKGRTLGRLISRPSIDDCLSIKRNAPAADRDDEPGEIAEAAGGAGPLTERIQNVLRDEKMGLARMGKILKADPNILSPILTRLVNSGRIVRRGTPRKYVYEAA